MNATQRSPQFASLLIWVLVAAPILAPAHASELTDSPNPATWVTNGVVNAVACTSSSIYIGGAFTEVGQASGQGLPLSGATGRPLANYSRVTGIINVCISDGARGWYIGGDFTKVGALARRGLAHIRSDGSVDPTWNPNPYSAYSVVIYALALSNGTLYVAGEFDGIGGQVRENIAALDAATGVAKDWNPGVSNGVYALAVSGGLVYAGGGFSNIGGQVRNRLAALDSVTGAVTAWNPDVQGWVNALAVANGVVYAGGYFSSIGGQARNCIAAVSAATGAVTNWNPGISVGNWPPNITPEVYVLAVSGGTVYVGGHFSATGGEGRNNLAALDAATGAATDWNPNPSAEVHALAIVGGTVYVGGDFGAIGGQTRRGLAAVNVATGALAAWDPNVNGAVNALAFSGGGVYAGGGFSIIGAQPRNHIAALDATTGAVMAWNPDAGGYNGACVNALAVSGGTVYAGGLFTSIGGKKHNNLAALDAFTGAALDWNPQAAINPLIRGINALAVSGSVVYIGNHFTDKSGQTSLGVAAINASGSATTRWQAKTNGYVFALAVADGVVYAGGHFTSIGGQARNNIAALNGATGIPTTWNPDAGGVSPWYPFNDKYPYVAALAASGGTVYAGGQFSKIGGQARNCIAALNTTTGTATAWNPNVGQFSPYIQALVVSGSTIYAGGDFEQIGGQERNSIAAIDAATGAATTWNPNASGWVNALAVLGRSIYAGGSFVKINGEPQTDFARFGADAPRTAIPAERWRRYR